MPWLKDPVARRLQDKVAIVTGAGRGIGRVYAMSLAQEGAKVCIAELNKDNGEEVAAEINELGGTAMAVPTDVADEKSTLAMANATAEAFGKIDILVNNAALFGDREKWDPYQGSMDYWNFLMSINVRGVLLGIRSVVPHMIKGGGGVIVNQASIGAYLMASLDYGLSKLAVIGMTVHFAKDLSPHSIRVNAISPGVTDTEALHKQLVISGGRPSDLAAGLPLKRLGTPEDLAAGLVFLCSDDASYITGETLIIDGGGQRRI